MNNWSQNGDKLPFQKIGRKRKAKRVVNIKSIKKNEKMEAQKVDMFIMSNGKFF